MGKYYPLGQYLKQSKNTNEILTYNQISSIIGDRLPPSAFKYREWWANEIIQNTRHTHCKQWLNAGWKVESVNLGVNVTFSKISYMEDRNG